MLLSIVARNIANQSYLTEHFFIQAKERFYSRGQRLHEWMNEWMIYLMSKTWEVFTQSSEPEAHVKNARQKKRV